MNAGIFTLLLLTSSLALAADWTVSEGSPAMRSAEMKDDGKSLALIWQDVIVPGQELVLIKATLGKDIFYHRFRFSGVSSSSLVLRVTGAAQLGGKGAAPEDPSFKDVLYVEQNSGGDYAFVPDDLKGYGYMRIARNVSMPGTYSVSLVKTTR